jgi:hypothetical protein
MKEERDYHTIDRGCSTIKGLLNRSEDMTAVSGNGKVFNHSDGIIYESDDGYRVLISLTSKELI